MSNSKEKIVNMKGKFLRNVGRKLLKRVGAVCLTSALLVSSVCSGVAVSASTTLLRGDINGDQTVNTADIALLHSYKNGGYNFSIDRLDVDGNGMFVYEDDFACLTNYVFGNGTPTNKTVYNETATSQGTDYYIEWTYTNGVSGMPTSFTKTIPVPGVSAPNPIAPMSIIDGDNRVDCKEDSIVRIGSYVNGVFGESWNGTAFIIGENKLATAAHCVSNESNIRQNVAIKCKNGAIYPVTYASVPYLFFSYGNRTYDYALIEVDTDVDLSEEYGAFTLGLLTDDKVDSLVANSNGTNIMVAGWSDGTLQIGSGTLLTSTHSDRLYYNSDMLPGDSGGPVFYDADGLYSTTNDRVVIGINAQQAVDDTFNCGPRINTRSYWFFNLFI